MKKLATLAKYKRQKYAVDLNNPKVIETSATPNIFRENIFPLMEQLVQEIVMEVRADEKS